MSWQTEFHFGPTPAGVRPLSIEEFGALAGVPAERVQECLSAQQLTEGSQDVQLPDAWREQAGSRYRAFVALTGNRDSVAAAAFWRSMGGSS